MKRRRFADLTPENQSRLRVLLTPRWNRFIAHEPHPRQHAGLLLNEKREMLFGGAAGGGKSDFLLMSALQFVDVPGYAAVILRRTFAQLSKAGGLLGRAEEWLTGKAQGVDTVKGIPTKWIFPSGAILEFGHCQYEKNRYDYYGAEYQFIGFDELTQFTERIYLYLMSRMRRLKGAPVPLRVRSASNPGGEGHDWVKARLVNNTHPNRRFLVSKLADNPSLDREEYESTLSELHPYDRAQLLEGNWDARPPGSKFKREWFDVIPEVPSDVSDPVRYWDLASTEPSPGTDPDYTAGSKMGRTPGGYFPILDMQHFRGTPHTVEQRVKQTAQIDGVGTRIFIEQEPGSSGKFTIDHFRQLLAGYPMRKHRPTGDKFKRMDPLASQAEARRIPLVNGPWVEPFLRELEMIPDGPHDDQGDASAGAFQHVTRPQRQLSVR